MGRSAQAGRSIRNASDSTSSAHKRSGTKEETGHFDAVLAAE